MLWTINASNVSLKCNQLRVSPSKVGSAMVGSLMCVLLECERGDRLLCPDRLVWGKLWLDEYGLTTGCRSSLNFVLTSKYWSSNCCLSTEWFVSSDNSSSLCAVSNFLNVFGSSSNLTWISFSLRSPVSMNVYIRVREAVATARCLMSCVRHIASIVLSAAVSLKRNSWFTWGSVRSVP